MAFAGALWMQPGRHADALRTGPLSMATPPVLAPAAGSAGAETRPEPAGAGGAEAAQLLEEAAVAWLEIDDAEETEPTAVEIDPLAALDLGGGMHDPLGPLDLLQPPDDPAALARWTAAMEEVIGAQERGG